MCRIGSSPRRADRCLEPGEDKPEHFDLGYELFRKLMDFIGKHPLDWIGNLPLNHSRPRNLPWGFSYPWGEVKIPWQSVEPDNLWTTGSGPRNIPPSIPCVDIPKGELDLDWHTMVTFLKTIRLPLPTFVGSDALLPLGVLALLALYISTLPQRAYMWFINVPGNGYPWMLDPQFQAALYPEEIKEMIQCEPIQEQQTLRCKVNGNEDYVFFSNGGGGVRICSQELG